MGTTIHSHVPSENDCTQTFFFDEKFLLDCHHTGLKLKRNTLPGSGYFDYLSSQEKIIFRYYKNVLEGIVPNETFCCPHPIKRVPAPVPNKTKVDEEGNWHYFHQEYLPGEFADTQAHDVDDFCPDVQLNMLISSKGPPDVYIQNQ